MLDKRLDSKFWNSCFGYALCFLSPPIPSPAHLDATYHFPPKEKKKRTRKKKETNSTPIFPGPRNGSSLPPRLPSLSSVLNQLHHNPSSMAPHSTSTTITASATTTYTFVALSYRGYWTSKGRPSQRGITLDAAAALAYVRHNFPPSAEEDVRLVLWGQSLGAGVALVAAAADLNPDRVTMNRVKGARKDSVEVEEERVQAEGKKSLEISGLLLETPFVSVRAMLPALYPERWLPYRYLGPFLTNHWDSEEALRKIGATSGAGCAGGFDPSFAKDHSYLSGTEKWPKVLILQAGRDEVVPKEHALRLETVCKEVGLQVRRAEVGGALHTEIIMKTAGKRAAVEFLREMTKN